MIKNRILIERRRFRDFYAKIQLKRHPELWAGLNRYLSETKSTGCSYIDYWYLFDYVKRKAPIEILECGTGVTTLVLAYALKELDQEGRGVGRITSMESHEEYLQMSRDLLPMELKKYVDFRLSGVMDDAFSIFTGVRYKEVPRRNYDFVFVDGPDYRSTQNGMLTFDFDFIHILQTSEASVSAIIDKRVSTCFVLQLLLGKEKVKYDPVAHLGFVKPSRAKDLISIDDVTPSSTFQKSFRAFTKTQLSYSRR